MNKRQRKKFEKKLCKKTYYQYRLERIWKVATKYLTASQVTTLLDGFNMLYIVDNRRMDLKHVQKVQLLENCYPISMNNPSGEQDILFEAKPVPTSYNLNFEGLLDFIKENAQ